jgi:hypothetical protein
MIRLQRSFFFGAGLLLVRRDAYATLKKVFDVLHENDNHKLPLKQTATNQ